MYFLLSGEGATDLGVCAGNLTDCQESDHLEGPMAIIVSQIAEQKLNSSFIKSGHYGYVSKSTLVKKAKVFKKQKKSPRLPGKKKPKETMYFYRNARALALCAKQAGKERNEEVIAVLFRDTDCKASTGGGLWEDKLHSMVRGFSDQDFKSGVPMIPNPISEAWIYCALKKHPYQGCTALENRPGGTRSKNPLKGKLDKILGGKTSREELCKMVNDRKIDCTKIDMPSFTAFKKALLDALS